MGGIYTSDLQYVTPDSDGILRLNRGSKKQSPGGGVLIEPVIQGMRLRVGADIKSASSITVPSDVDDVLITGTTPITEIKGGEEGRVITLFFDARGLRIFGPNLIIRDTMYYSEVDASLTLHYFKGKWREASRTNYPDGLATWLWMDGNQTIPDDVFTTVGQPGAPWSVIQDPGGLWNPSLPEALIYSCPVNGLYEIGGVMKWDTSNVGHRNVATYIENRDKTDNIASDAPDPDANFHQCFWTKKFFQKGDMVKLRVEQKSGADLQIIGQGTTDIVCYARLVGALSGPIVL